MNVLDSTYYNTVAHNILQLKRDGFNVISYCRKSKIPTKYLEEGLLQRMVSLLFQRSLVDRVFVSPYSSAKRPLTKKNKLIQLGILDTLGMH
ncbi:uncharacterized protein BX663DRAFT_436354 [Cokeromyces recurvatus]|uniref:uncharacterized protein n=1 Tax=Cokeromyces recurvatus TaxID=90255 RepID=UPI00221E89F2|nr:uncharacterized protein BX663DRAFT_436354 [Cokeromyces recurvatus]KAI7901898.1 hypothetical protein BX663DRAFT_436354 [Cokeromyces recurvatus]